MQNDSRGTFCRMNSLINRPTIERDVVQPPGAHNPSYPCVRTSCFSHLVQYPFSHFNPPQSEFCEVLYDDCNIVVCWPTGAGKTVAMELSNAKAKEDGGKCLNLFPLKALTEEKLMDWSESAHTFNKYKIVPITGDYVLDDAKKKELESADIIVATSEMLDSKTRNYTRNSWLKDVSLLVVDEAHLLGSPSRGPRLESAIMRFISNNPQARIVLMSATVPNRFEIAEWIESITGRKTKILDSNFRPCILNKTFVKFDDMGSKKYDRIEELRMHSVYENIKKNIKDQQLVFTGPKSWGYKFKDFLIRNGIPAEFHNADLPKEKRREIEKKFREREIHILVSTSTLSWGCHAWGSQIMMEDNSEKDVKYISPGDYVLSHKIEDKESCGFYSRKVIKSKHFKVDKSIEITVKLTTGRPGEIRKCHVTTDHMFLTGCSDNLEWITADNLNIGDNLRLGDTVLFDDKEVSLLNSFIIDIQEKDGGDFQELEIEDLHNYICDKFISHNCNLPARRVNLAHTTYGVEPMEICDIEQGCGRAGRIKYDPAGDAYIFIPASIFDEEVRRIQGGFQVISTIDEIPNLAFHAVSEISSGNIKTSECFHEWYEKSLAYAQGKKISDEDCANLFGLLEKIKMIRPYSDKDGIDSYEATSLGQITSDMYMNPFDVFDWFKNFCNIDTINTKKEMNNFDLRRINKDVSMALANCYAFKKGKTYCSKAESLTNTVSNFQGLVGPDIKGGVLKAAACYYSMMNGKDIEPALKGTYDGLKLDIQRILATIKQIHKRYGYAMESISGYKFNEKEWDILYYRIIYGVPKEMVSLVAIPGIGKTYSQRLFDRNIRSFSDFRKNPEISKSIVGQNRYEKIISETLKQG